jgi:hypothetical protein
VKTRKRIQKKEKTESSGICYANNARECKVKGYRYIRELNLY